MLIATDHINVIMRRAKATQHYSVGRLMMASHRDVANDKQTDSMMMSW